MTKDEIIEDFRDSLKGKSLTELAGVMNGIRNELNTIKAQKAILEAKHDALRLGLVPSAMEDDNITTISINGIGRVTLAADVYASILAANRPKAYQWLRDNKHGDVIKETVNSGTLKALVKSIIKKGEETIPEELFKVTPFTRASITSK